MSNCADRSAQVLLMAELLYSMHAERLTGAISDLGKTAGGALFMPT